MTMVGLHGVKISALSNPGGIDLRIALSNVTRLVCNGWVYKMEHRAMRMTGTGVWNVDTEVACEFSRRAFVWCSATAPTSGTN